jgi:aspyridone synthetase trans-acting enoyl reductase
MKICYSAIAMQRSQAFTRRGTEWESSRSPSHQKARYVSLDPFPIRGHTRRSIHPSWIIAFTVLDTPVNWQYPFQREAKPEQRAFAGQVWVPLVQQLLDKQLIHGFKAEARYGGLANIMEGLSDVRMGLIKGIKLVYAVT